MPRTDAATNTKELFFDKADGIPFIQCGAYRLQFEMEPLDEVHQKRAFEEIGETEEVRGKAIDAFRQLIHAEEDFFIPQHEDFLMKFLRPSNLDAQEAFTKMCNFYKLLNDNPKYTEGISVDLIKDVYTMGILHYFPYRVNGTRVMILDLDKWDPKRVPLETIIKSFLVSIEIAMNEPITQLYGAQLILDARGLSMKHVFICNPWLAKFLLDILQNVPLKVKGIHVVNQNRMFGIAFAFFKPFIRGRLKDEIILHRNNTLHDHISPKYLPKRFNGEIDIPNLPGELIVEMIRCYEEYFAGHRNYGYQKATA